MYQLRSIAKDLVRLLGWQEAEATVFILTDLVPLLPTFGITISPGPILMDEDLQLNCLTRISLTVSPLSTPREVAKGYEKIRATVLKGRARALTEKHMHLAAYCASLFPLDRSHMIEWNKVYPKWHYVRFSIFNRDALTARARLLDLPIDHTSAFDLKVFADLKH